MPFPMFDTVTVSTVPSFANTSADAVAGYVDGLYNDMGALKAAFPKSKHLDIAVFPRDDATCLDVENGDATPDQVPAWVARQEGRGVVKPVVYCSASVAPQVLARVPRSRIRLWTAHYTYRPHICGPGCGYGNFTADATQWTDRALGRNLDESLCQDNFLGLPKPPPDPYAAFPRTRVRFGTARIDEYDTVREYDTRVDHKGPHSAADVARVRVLKARMTFLRRRIWVVAHLRNPLRPQWSVANRGWRWQQLAKRTK